jgi:predicted amidohydrolase YtcJ
MGEMLSYGITSYIDAGIGEEGLQAYATLADNGELKQRVQGCIAWRPSVGVAPTVVADPIERRNLYARDRFKPDCIKIVLDGVPTDGHTAAMVEPYADASHADAARARGMLMVPAQALKTAVIDFDARGFTVKMHAAGDAAVRAGLDAIEAARKANGFTGLLHNVSHNSFVQMSDFGRAREISATFEMSPYIWYPNPIIPDIAKAVGPERMKRWTPVKDAIDSGALVVPGSDWAVVPSVNPWIAVETLVTRQAPGGVGEPLGAVEKITLEQAIGLFTVNSARLMGDRNRTGSLEKGMLADLVVLDRNPFRIPITQVHQTRVRMTVINGEIVYQSKP